MDYAEMGAMGSGVYTGNKQSQALTKVIKSAGSALGADEIDSESRTNEDDSEHLSATQ